MKNAPVLILFSAFLHALLLQGCGVGKATEHLESMDRTTQQMNQNIANYQQSVLEVSRSLQSVAHSLESLETMAQTLTTSFQTLTRTSPPSTTQRDPDAVVPMPDPNSESRVQPQSSASPAIAASGTQTYDEEIRRIFREMIALNQEIAALRQQISQTRLPTPEQSH